MVIILMGVAGAGKTTLGKRLAEALGWRFLEGDDFHPPENVAKMASGVPLTDVDRAPWLERLRGLIAEAVTRGEDLVVACSGLRRSYRLLLTVDPSRVRWVYLSAPREEIARRLKLRQGHFMPPSLLDSQFETLEAPEDALEVDVAREPEEVVAAIRAGLKV
ncbi:gluconokinase [Hyalangium rubrum]|uniref:Gluconokinase n=1 Tax=Hyalangium rubrum TaxID=3103134 RepID=A0ABU5GXM2_9BACT|nr:gluconokinase [Hyalangium sp. s54d21]MDY7225933.1 gluconokinase [Hyalangium sp. s54d21]